MIVFTKIYLKTRKSLFFNNHSFGKRKKSGIQERLSTAYPPEDTCAKYCPFAVLSNSKYNKIALESKLSHDFIADMQYF